MTPPDSLCTVVPTDLDPTALAARKPPGLTVSVCLPARNEAATVAPICEVIAGECAPLVDELVVLDDGSTDDTAALAAAAGAKVVAVEDVLPDQPPGRGKGNVLWSSLAVSHGDLVVWCDADLRSFTSAYVTRLVAPLLDDPSVQLVKGFYDRPIDAEGHGGGRNTELVARPLLARLFPELACLLQPLSGECAGRRPLLEALPFVQSYGVEIGLLVDAFRRVGADAIVQVDLGTKVHRHRPLHELAAQAGEIIDTVLGRAGVAGVAPVAERPPMASLR